MDKRIESWTGANVSDISAEQRPALIIHHYLRRQVKRGAAHSYADAVSQFAERTGIPEERARQLASGASIPLAVELDRICSGLEWSLFFLVGVREAAIDERTAMYFSSLGVEEPSVANRKAFRELYENLIKHVIDKRASEREDAHD